MKRLLLVLSVLSVAASAQEAAPPAGMSGPPPGMKPMPQPARGPSFDLALDAAQTAFNLCKSQGHEVVVVVADTEGGIKVALVPDSKPAMLVEFAQRKIAAALEFKMNSGDVQALAKTDKAVADKVAANNNFFAVPGAVLMKAGSEIVGVIAGSGAKSDEDAACAQAGLDKVQARLK